MALTNLEKENLATHVELCALRYSHLDDRLTELEGKVDNIHKDILEGQKSLSKVIIGTTGTIMVGVISAVSMILAKAI